MSIAVWANCTNVPITACEDAKLADGVALRYPQGNTKGQAGWDVGGTIACFTAATAFAAGIAPAAILLFALVGILPQTWLARRHGFEAVTGFLGGCIRPEWRLPIPHRGFQAYQFGALRATIAAWGAAPRKRRPTA